MQTRHDPARDRLYAVVHYPTDSRDDGNYLLPENLRERICGDFLTLRVRLSPQQARVATVALGMGTEDIAEIEHMIAPRKD